MLEGFDITAIIISAVGVSVVLFSYFYSFTRYSRIQNFYRRRIDAIYNSLSNDKDECREGLRELRMEILEILDKGNIRHRDYEILNKKISGYLDNISKE
jgi:hypothetical protein